MVDIDGDIWQVRAVPEPATLCLVGGGVMAGYLAWQRRAARRREAEAAA
jgi:hypothetical protein